MLALLAPIHWEAAGTILVRLPGPNAQVTVGAKQDAFCFPTYHATQLKRYIAFLYSALRVCLRALAHQRRAATVDTSAGHLWLLNLCHVLLTLS